MHNVVGTVQIFVRGFIRSRPPLASHRGIHDQIHDDLFHLAGVGFDGTEVFGGTDLKVDVFTIKRGSRRPMSSTTSLRFITRGCRTCMRLNARS